MTYPTIYKRDTKGIVRTWRMEREGSSHRVVTARLDGQETATGWSKVQGKQGRDDVTQAEFEIAAKYKNKLAREYHQQVDTTDTANFFIPMLAKKYERFSPGFAQPKLDGIRCIATREGLFTREGQPIGGAPHICTRLAELFVKSPDAILDGEMYNHDLKEDFNTIVSLVRRNQLDPGDVERSARLVQYHVYDLPSSSLTFSARHQQLSALVGGSGNEGIHIVETGRVDDEDAYNQLHGGWLEAGYEGSMWRSDGPYEQKRSKMLLKRKEFQDQEFECVSIEAGSGNWAGLAKSVVCRLPDGRTFGAGIKGSQERASELLGEKHTVVTVQFFHLTPDGIPRFPVVTKFWGTGRRM